MSTKPLVNITVPVYNSEKYLDETLKSIFQQTYKNFKCIILNDGSTDNSQEIITNWTKKDSRFMAVENKKNRGLVYSRNKILEQLDKEATYVGILDADDYVDINWLSSNVSYLETNKEVAVVGLSIKYVDKHGKQVGTKKLNSQGDVKRSILIESPIPHGGALIRLESRKKVGLNYNNSFSRAHDYELRSRFVGNGFRIDTNPDSSISSYHRLHGSEQGKFKYLKLTLKNTLRIKYSLMKKYKLKPSISAVFRMVGESILYVLPTSFVYRLFKKYNGIQN